MIDELDMHEILRVLYPDQIADDEDESFDASYEANNQTIMIGDREVKLGEFIYELLLLAPVLTSPLSGKQYHVLMHGNLAVAKRLADDVIL